jgi:hypothetical protein
LSYRRVFQRERARLSLRLTIRSTRSCGQNQTIPCRTAQEIRRRRADIEPARHLLSTGQPAGQARPRNRVQASECRCRFQKLRLAEPVALLCGILPRVKMKTSIGNAIMRSRVSQRTGPKTSFAPRKPVGSRLSSTHSTWACADRRHIHESGRARIRPAGART